MLQEILEKSTHSPAEVALMLTTYVESELPAGGVSAEKRFFELFPTLCERVFGPISPTDYRHEIGGWMSRERRWDYSTSASKPRSPHHLGQAKSPSIRSDPVVLLLGTGRKTTSSKEQSPLILIDAFAKETEDRQNIRYDFPFLALPKPMQDEWLAVIQATMGGVWAMGENLASENSNRLFGSLFRAAPRQQENLLMYQQSKAQTKAETQRRPLQLNPLFSSPNTARSPMAQTPTATNSPGKTKDDAPPKAFLSMLEYYLLVFIRYPLASPDQRPATISNGTSTGNRIGSLASYQRRSPYGDAVYNQLFAEYATYYVPIRSKRGAFEGFSTLGRPSELFVRLVAALWLESRNRLDTNAKACTVLQQRRGVDVSLDLCASFDLVKASYSQLPTQVTQCLSLLVSRVVVDATVANFSERISIDYKGKEDILLCLSPTMEILQAPIYNHIRNVFRNAPIHGRDNTFNCALNDWLIWLEPWNTHFPSATTSARSAVAARVGKDMSSNTFRYLTPKFSQGSKYTPIWEAYIASNLHFYTVPLALFLRRARELDFSEKYYKNSVETVLRVLRVYSPEVVVVINRLLQVRDIGGTNTLDVPFAKMVWNHEKKLGLFGPPQVVLTMSSLQSDVQNLLEEIYLQQSKNAEQVNILNKWVDKFFNSGTQHKEQKELHSLTEKAKVIFGFPSNFEVAPLKDKSRNIDGCAAKEGKLRTSDGLYSENGLRHAAAGDIKCKPEEIVYIGDRMHAKCQSYEIAFLIRPLIDLSILLNNRLGLENGPKPSKEYWYFPHRYFPHRVNLRFLADYRNLGFLLLFLWWLFR